MMDPLTYIFMGISLVSVGLNIPLLKRFQRCTCTNDGHGEMRCSSSCNTTPKIKNVRKDYTENESHKETKEQSPG